MTGLEALMATQIAGDLTLGTALTVGGLAVSVAGAIAGGQQQAAANRYNARVAENAAAASRQQAAVEVARQRRRVNLLMGSQRAATAGSGVTAEGSPLLVMSDTAAQGEYDAELIRYGGEVGATQDFAQAAADRVAARQARLGSYFGAGGTLLLAGGVLGKGTSNKTFLGDAGALDTLDVTGSTAVV